MDVKPGYRLGRYILEEPLGKGGQGVVFYARQVNAVDGKPCVVKLAKKAVFDDADRQQFLDEARRAISLGAHPNIVQVLDADEQDGVPFFVMEYSDGVDLQRVFEFHRKRGDALLWEATYTILKHMADALHYAHFRRKIGGRPIGMIHRDIKPANTLVTFDGYAKLLDFGISVFRDEKHTGMHMRGTPRYMSPEHVYSTPCPEMDIYSLGVVAWEMLEGREYREGLAPDMIARANCHEEAPPITNPEAPEELVDLIMTCLAEDKTERPTADEFSKWLETCPGYRFSTESVRVLVTNVVGRPARSRETLWSVEVPEALRDATAGGKEKPVAPSMVAPVAENDAEDDGDTVAWVRTGLHDTTSRKAAEPDAPRVRRRGRSPGAAAAGPEAPATVALRGNWVVQDPVAEETEAIPSPFERGPTAQGVAESFLPQRRQTEVDAVAPAQAHEDDDKRRTVLLFGVGVLTSFGLAVLAGYLLGAWGV